MVRYSYISMIRTVYDDHVDLVSQKNSSSKPLPPIANVHHTQLNLLNPPLFSPNRPVQVNVYTENIGPVIAQDSGSVFRFYIIDAKSHYRNEDDEDDLYAQFLQFVNSHRTC